MNKKIEWRGTMEKIHLLDVEAATIEEYINNTINSKDPTWEISNFIAYVKAHHARARVMPQENSDLSIGKWQKIANIIIDQSERFKHQLDIILELYCEASTGKKKGKKEKDADIRGFMYKRSYNDLLSNPISIASEDDSTFLNISAIPISHPKRRKGGATRTTKLLNESRERALVAQQHRRFEKALLDR